MSRPTVKMTCLLKCVIILQVYSAVPKLQLNTVKLIHPYNSYTHKWHKLASNYF